MVISIPDGREDKKREDEEEIGKEEKKRHYGHFVLSSYHGELIFCQMLYQNSFSSPVGKFFRAILAGVLPFG